MEKWLISANNLLEASYSAKSLKAHAAAYNSYLEFCQMVLENPLPITVDKIISYLACKSTVLKHTTLKSYLSAISTVVKSRYDVDAADVIWGFKTKRILQGIKKKQISSGVASNRKMPITRAMISNLREKLILSFRDHMMLFSCICLLYAGLFRVGEVLGENSVDAPLRWKHVTVVDENELTVRISSSKTDVYGQACDIRIFSVESDTCAVKALKEYKKMLQPALTRPECPVFVDLDGRALNRGEFNERLKLLITECGSKGELYSAHSLRRGHATDLYLNGVNVDTIKLVGRWKSESAYQVYIGNSISNIREAVKSAALVPDKYRKLAPELLYRTGMDLYARLSED